MTDDRDDSQEQYVVAINDLFAVPKDAVDSPQEAEQYVLDRLGQDGWIPTDAEVIDTYPE